MQENEDKFVKRHEWIESRGKIYQEIHKIDAKHNENYNILNNKMDRMEIYQSQYLDGQKEQTKELKTLNTNLSDVMGRVIDLEYQSKDTVEDLSGIKSIMNERSKSNVQIITALIGGLSTVVVAIIGLARLLF